MRYIILILALFLTSCASSNKIFNSPNGNVSLCFISKDTNGKPLYQILTKDGAELGQVKSIIDAKAVKNVPGLPVEHDVIWSPSGWTALIYENMSDASPNYQYVLICLHPDLKSYYAYEADFGTRHTSREDSYGHWPSVDQISDFEIELKWQTEPKNETVKIAKFITDAQSISKDGEVDDR
jgi:predicted transposase YbfD/YdcC